MSLLHLELIDFRSFRALKIDPDPAGTTVITGPNGAGKTTILEAIAYLGSQRSFRGAQREVMIRTGCEEAFIRAEVANGERRSLIEAQVVGKGRSRLQVNRQQVAARREAATVAPCTVFSPEDLLVVHGGPSYRRALLDDALSAIDVGAAQLCDDVDKTLRQRAALLRQSNGRLSAEIRTTLDVWDERLSVAGTALVEKRQALLEALLPLVRSSYESLAKADDSDVFQPARDVSLHYRSSWEGSLLDALVGHRELDVRRAVTSVGPHRDDVEVRLAERDARVQASQGEQRSLALAMRLAVHQLVASHLEHPPILLLDDVFSELDPHRSQALIEGLPPGQTLLTTAAPLPSGVGVTEIIDVRELTQAPDLP